MSELVMGSHRCLGGGRRWSSSAWSLSRRRRSARLKEHFGPEYERTVGELGEQRAAEAELVQREKKRKKLDIVDLTPEAQAGARGDLAEGADRVRRRTPDAVGRAERLVTRVMRERGYPIDDFDQRAADISVDHPDIVDNYRSAHAIYRSQHNGDISTEDARQAFVHYRALFDRLLGSEIRDREPRPRQTASTANQGGRPMTAHDTQPGTETRQSAAIASTTAEPTAEPRPGGDSGDAPEAAVCTCRNRRCRQPILETSESADQMLFADGELTDLRSRWTDGAGGLRRRSPRLRAEGRRPGGRRGRQADDGVRRGPLATSRSSGARGEEVSTEDLRIALKRYREFFERLLAV